MQGCYQQPCVSLNQLVLCSSVTEMPRLRNLGEEASSQVIDNMNCQMDKGMGQWGNSSLNACQFRRVNLFKSHHVRVTSKYECHSVSHVNVSVTHYGLHSTSPVRGDHPMRGEAIRIGDQVLFGAVVF